MGTSPKSYPQKSWWRKWVAEYPGNFWFPNSKLLLSSYVDDLTLAGPSDAHDPFWKKFTSHVDIEPAEKVYRILGRNHVDLKLPKTDGAEQCAAYRAQDGLVLDMADYATQTVELYKQISKIDKLREAQTPFIPDGSYDEADQGARGELAPNACRILMKALWLGRLCRPDIIKPINDLATKVQSWTSVEDKKLHRLIQFINSTIHYRLVGTIQDPLESLELVLYVDADFCGDHDTGKSTSG